MDRSLLNQTQDPLLELFDSIISSGDILFYYLLLLVFVFYLPSLIGGLLNFQRVILRLMCDLMHDNYRKNKNK